MKKFAYTLLISFASVAASNAATIVFTNSNGTETNAITDSLGVAYQGAAATVSIGYFNISDANVSAATTPATLLSAFQNYGSTSTGFTLAGPPAQNNRGFFTLNAPATQIGGTAFEGKSIYIFVQNAAGTEFAVLKSTLTFTAADDATLPNVTKTFTLANIPVGNVLIGGTAFSVLTSNVDTTNNTSYSTKSLNAVPEPSSMLLGAIGALGLLRRRR